MPMTAHVQMQLDMIECSSCGILFGVPADYIRRRREDGQNFYCPSHHANAFGDTDLMKLQRQLQSAQNETVRKQQQLDQAKAEIDQKRKQLDKSEKRRTALKGVVTRTRKKVAAGKCPCCGEQFENLRAHMTRKHPAYIGHAKDEGATP